MQKLFTFIVAAVIIYVLMNTKFAEFQKSRPQGPAPTADTSEVQESKPEGNFLERSLSKVLINILKTNEGRTFFENLIQPANKPLSQGVGFKLDNSRLVEAMFKINTYGEGSVGPASCGHIVTAAYQLTTIDNGLVQEETKTFDLGGSEVMRGISDIIVGMYEGQSRDGIIPPQYANGAKVPNIAYKVKVKLQSIVPKVFAKPLDIKIFDDEIAYSKPCLCGERVTFDVNIKRFNGEVIYDSIKSGRKISMLLGDLAYPMVFSHGLFNKVPVGSRTVIAQGKYLRSLASSKASRIFQNQQPNAEEFFILEFKNFEGV